MVKIKEDEHLVDSEILLSKISSKSKRKGVIHVGAHLGEEAELYFKFGFTNIVFVEANPKIYAELALKFKDEPRVRCFNAAISSKTEPSKFRVYISRTNNTESSSILPFDQFDKIVPTLKLKEELELMSYSLQDFIENNDLNIENYNMLVTDIQGADYLALKGAQSYLRSFDFIITELNYLSLYKDSKNDEKIKGLLSSLGFHVEEEIIHTLYQDSNVFPAWGEGLFIKKE